MNSKDFGDIGELQTMLALTKMGYHVSIPFDDNSRYDLIVEGSDGKLYKVQCKYTTLDSTGAIKTNCYSSRHSSSKDNTEKAYVRNLYSKNEIDYIAVYCPETDKVYMLDSHEFVGKTVCSLRVTPPANGQSLNVRYAEDYEITKIKL